MHSARKCLTHLLIVAIPLLIVIGGILVLSGRVPPSSTDDAGSSGEPALRDTPASDRTVASGRDGAKPQQAYDEAPDFERVAMDGSTVRLSSIRGNVVVVNFWATWCTPCRVETPEFVKMNEELDGVQFIGISLDEEGFDAVRPYAELQAQVFFSLSGPFYPRRPVFRHEWRGRSEQVLC